MIAAPSYKFKNRLKCIIQAKDNLDQNFKYLEEDLRRNDACSNGDQRQIADKMSTIVREISKMNSKDLNKINKLVQNDRPKGDYNFTTEKLNPPTSIPDELPMPTMPTISINAPSTNQKQVVQPKIKPSTYKFQPNLQFMPPMKYIPRASVLSEPKTQTTNNDTQDLLKALKDNLILNKKREPKQRVKLTTGVIPTIHLNDNSEQQEQKVKNLEILPQQPSTISLSGTNVEKLASRIEYDSNIENIYQTALSFVEREVTASITENLVKNHINLTNNLREKYKSVDLDSMVINEIKTLIGQIKKTNESKVATPKIPSPTESSQYDNDFEEIDTIKTPITTPNISPNRSPNNSLRHSITSFKQSVVVDTIVEDEKESEPLSVPDFKASVIIQDIVEETENEESKNSTPISELIFDKVPVPSGVVLDGQNTATIEPSEHVTVLSTDVCTDDEKSEPTFTPMTETYNTTTTISMGQLIIEPGELYLAKQDRRSKWVLPNYYGQEPGEIDKNRKMVNALDNVGPEFIKNLGRQSANILKNGGLNNSNDTINGVTETFTKDVDKEQKIVKRTKFSDKIEFSDDDGRISRMSMSGRDSRLSTITDSERLEPSISEGEFILSKRFQRWREQASFKLSESSQNDNENF